MLVPTAYLPKKPSGRNQAIISLSILSAKPPAIPTIWNGLDFLIKKTISFQEVVKLAFVCTRRTSVDDTTEVR